MDVGEQAEILKQIRIPKIKTINIIIKRIIDVIAGIIGLIFLIPITIYVKILSIIYKEKESIFFKQERIGKNGKPFKMYKFRTMIIGAEEKLHSILEQNEEMKEEYLKNKKLKNDPRITKVGKILRKTSLDEFPQFINVLLGNMSLVGPRPYLEKEKEDMGDYFNYIVKCKPGLTGPWQVSGRNDTTFNHRLELDFEYFQQNNFKQDSLILLKTVFKVLKKEGAI